jgi:hypothetical protein
MLWESLCESDTIEIFDNMTEYLEEKDDAFEEMKPHILTHLTLLERSFKNPFPELILQQHKWTRNPFGVAISEKISLLSIKSKVPLMELFCNTSLKINFEALSLSEFWIYKKKALVTLTSSHLGVTTFWNDVSV